MGEDITGVKKGKELTFVYGILALVILAVLFIALSTNSFGFRKSDLRKGEIRPFNDGWIVEGTGDGIRADDRLTLPTENLRYEGTTVTLRNTIPEGVTAGEYLFVTGYHQSVSIYIDGVRVNGYKEDVEPVKGEAIETIGLMVPLTEEMAGQEVKIRLSSYYDKYRRTVRGIYIGTEFQYITFLKHHYGADVILGALLVIVGAIIVICGVVEELYGKKKATTMIGIFSIGTGVWALTITCMRDVFISNIPVAEPVSYILIALIPIPLYYSVDRILKRRYHRLFSIINNTHFFLAILFCILHVLRVVPLSISQYAAQTFLIFSGILVFNILTYEAWQRKEIDVQIVAVGYFGLLFNSLIRILALLVFNMEMDEANVLLYLGVFFVIIMVEANELRNRIYMERECKKAEEESIAKSALLANMSHEIRTPITAIMGMDEMILRENVSEYVRDYAQKIRSASDVLLTMINNVLDYSKLEAGHDRVKEGEYSVEELLRDVINIMEVRAADKRLDFRVDIDPRTPKQLVGDSTKIRQILLNILSNAVKYTEQGSVSLVLKSTTEEDTCSLRFSIRDTGIGIHKEDMVRLGSSYSRFDEEKNKNIQGTGLGMNLTVRYLEMMGSRLEVSSIYQQGSTFSFELQQKITDVTTIGEFHWEEEKDRTDVRQVHMTAPNAKILVVDDNAMNLEVITGLLRSTESKVTAVLSGKEMLELCEKETYDLIFLDHLMPDMDGVETLALLRKQEEYREHRTPVIVLTANVYSSAREEYRSLGFQDYISKPVDYRELERLMMRYLPDFLLVYRQKSGEIIPKTLTDKEESEETMVLDLRKGFEYTGEDEKQYKKYLEYYLSFEPETRKNITEYMEKDDIENFVIAVHALKSNARSIGGMRLGDKAYELELKGKEKDLPYIGAHFRELIFCMDELVDEIQRVLRDYDDALSVTVKKETEPVQIPVSEADEWIMIADLISRYDRKSARHILQEKLNACMDKGLEEELKEILVLLEEFELEEAEERVRALTTKYPFSIMNN